MSWPDLKNVSIVGVAVVVILMDVSYYAMFLFLQFVLGSEKLDFGELDFFSSFRVSYLQLKLVINIELFITYW